MKRKLIWMLAVTRPLVLIMAFCGASVLTSCSNDDDPVAPPIPTDEVEAQLQQMTLREKVGQMFYVRPEALDPTLHWTTSDEGTFCPCHR